MGLRNFFSPILGSLGRAPDFRERGPGGNFGQKAVRARRFFPLFWVVFLRVAVLIVFSPKIDEKTMKNQIFFDVVFVRRALGKKHQFLHAVPTQVLTSPVFFFNMATLTIIWFFTVFSASLHFVGFWKLTKKNLKIYKKRLPEKTKKT